MQVNVLQRHTAKLVSAALCLCEIMGCGGGSRNIIVNPITVSLPVSTAEVTAGDGTTSIPILINSPSETAQVSVTELPAGVQSSYSASDTNPSGILTFGANRSTAPGTYMPVVSVTSSWQTVATTFTLVVKSP